MTLLEGNIDPRLIMSNKYKNICLETPRCVENGVCHHLWHIHEPSMQQGDCNTPATFQQPMTVIFQDNIGRFIHVCLHDI